MSEPMGGKLLSQYFCVRDLPAEQQHGVAEHALQGYPRVIAALRKVYASRDLYKALSHEYQGASLTGFARLLDQVPPQSPS
jgi:hypothetical protein